MSDLILRDGSDEKDSVDLARLSPRARALAECLLQDSHPVRRPVVLASTAPVRDLFPQSDHIWFAADDLDAPHHVMWSHWASYPAASTVDAHDYLEGEARKLPIGYHPIGLDSSTQVPSADAAADDARWLSRAQVLELLRGLGRPIAVSTWSAYTARGQAPAPGRYVGRTPLWDRDAIEAWR